MARIFKDDRLQQQFELKGYVVVPFLAKEEVNHLKALYQQELLKHPGDFTPPVSAMMKQ